jgi:hypothetical protein
MLRLLLEVREAVCYPMELQWLTLLCNIGSKFERNLPAPILDRKLISPSYKTGGLTIYLAPPHITM